MVCKEQLKFIINENQAKIVRRIYRDFLQGLTIADIAHALNEDGICRLRGKPAWRPVTIIGMLENELYKGDLRMQKVYTKDFLTHQQVKNEGKYEQYYVEKTHPAIIDPEEWEAVQLELKRRAKFKADHNLSNESCHICESAFVSEVFCGKCGARYGRKTWTGRACYWMCQNR